MMVSIEHPDRWRSPATVDELNLGLPLPRLSVTGQRRIAAIDIGTNSIHMVVVDINPDLPTFQIIDTEKSTVRLGERCPETGQLTEPAMERSLEALSRCQEIAQARQVEEIIAAATSAVREAPNGREFVQRVQDQLGLSVDIIAGEEEARRIYLGVLSGLDFEGQTHVIVDIGGGSTELILGDGHKARSLSSTKVGAVRLKELFIEHDPILKREFSTMKAYVRGMMERAIEDVRSKIQPGEMPPRLVGTSGTIESLVKIAACEFLGACPTSLHGYELDLEVLQDLVQRLCKLSYEDRCRIPGMSERRAEIILAGAVILLVVMEQLEIRSLSTCERALREGMIVDWMLRYGLIEDRLRYQSSIRERTVINMAQRYQVNLDSSQRIAWFAVQIFDQIREQLHHWGPEERELLWAAGILHNVGHFVSHAAHHKHSYYLIRHAGLLGFSDTEIELIANFARYHRKGPPKKKHDPYRNLSKQDRAKVNQLSAILKLAVALDRREIGAITDLRCEFDPENCTLVLHLQPQWDEDDCDLELWSLNYKKASFEAEFEISLRPHLMV
ncbi:Ppx/GppA phosphatase family protein [Lyngbya confervoides]|uniref:Ppx/GppA family phosphatase n=1 Tax=Lyngbya confervoides BDU141951 TaxID=1574623 RepID=A0ABD4SZ27_9CYAN|nr:Ppx/GppA phosphatase family protein [Lyngbya confervoides]MCM1981539.1 Ppx/GppA family phosphatase [Lyngbya confervoides BDU141951]